jgi:hypothetical protein
LRDVASAVAAFAAGPGPTGPVPILAREKSQAGTWRRIDASTDPTNQRLGIGLIVSRFTPWLAAASAARLASRSASLRLRISWI